MLKAILEGKAGRVDIEAASVDVSWRDVFRKREDLLTAVFFSRLRYLSVDGQQEILRLLINQEPSLLGEINEIVFWPKLRGLEDRSYVEPDVILIFDDSLLLVEVKPPFGGEQDESQWHNEVSSLLLQRDQDEPEIEVPEKFHFLALGRNVSDSQEAAKRLRDSFFEDGLVSIQLREWDKVCQGVHKLADAAKGADRVIYKDWIDAFTLFGLVAPPLPFEDLKKLKNATYLEWKRLMRAFEIPAEVNVSGPIRWEPLVGKSEIGKGNPIWQ